MSEKKRASARRLRETFTIADRMTSRSPVLRERLRVAIATLNEPDAPTPIPPGPAPSDPCPALWAFLELQLEQLEDIEDWITVTRAELAEQGCTR
jgi:hypothetical protein